MFTDRFGKVSMMEMQTEGGKQEMVAECSLMDVTQTEYVPVDLYRPSRTWTIIRPYKSSITDKVFS